MENKKERRERIASAVKVKAKKMGMTQTWIAEQIGVSQPTIAELFNGKREFTAHQTVQLSKLLDIPECFLELGEGDAYTETNNIEIDASGKVEMSGNSQYAGRDLNNASDPTWYNIMDRQLRIMESQEKHLDRMIAILERMQQQ